MANSNRKIAAGGALYLYGISEAPALPASNKPASKLAQRFSLKVPKIGSVGIDGVHAVQPLACGDFICWVCEVDQASFAGAIERNMENLEWLALHGIRHQQVVGEVAEQIAIVPARFGTVFSGEPALLKDVQGRKAALKKVFARVAGGDEWGVKVFAERQVTAVARTEARSGKEYLQQKAARLKKPERNDHELLELATALGKIAIASAPSGKVSGAQPNLLWQATFLVPRAKRKQWDQALKSFVERWEGQRRIEVNGPWPPYSFVSDAE
ncbi:MAG TPA: GvpL/GvpF family gas vesicle protein [Candidatus Acidoferrales bacterium]|nr:GvpL/GvpF family gas vesicle protein [Candidatus Acidoferrales bacterium]